MKILIFLAIFLIPSNDAKNIYQESLGLYLEEDQNALIVKGHQKILWSIHYITPCQNLSTDYLKTTKNCDVRDKHFLSKSKELLQNCKNEFLDQISSLKKIIPSTLDTFNKSMLLEYAHLQANIMINNLNRERRFADFIPVIGTFAEFITSVNTNRKVSKMRSEFKEFRSWNEKKISDLSKNIVDIATLAERNNREIVELSDSICDTLISNNDEILHFQLQEMFKYFYDNMMGDIIRFSNGEIPAKNKIYSDILDLCKKFQSPDLDENTLTFVCNKLIRSTEFNLIFAGVEISGSHAPSLSVNIFLQMPIINPRYLAYRQYFIFNSGFFYNQSFYEIEVPQRVIVAEKEVISISQSCSNLVCNIKHLTFDRQSRCVDKILKNKPLNNCNRKNFPDQLCNIKYIKTGVIISAAHALIVYHNQATISINYATKKVSGQGSVVCNFSNNYTKTFRFDSEIVKSDTFISLPKIKPVKLQTINKTKNFYDRIKISENIISDSHFELGSNILIGHDILYFAILLLIVLIIFLIFRSQKHVILNSLTRSKTILFCVGWCRKKNIRDPQIAISSEPQILYSVKSEEIETVSNI